MDIEKKDWEALVVAQDAWAKTDDDDKEADADFALAAQEFVENVLTAWPKKKA